MHEVRVIKLPRSEYLRLVEGAKTAYPNEGCGLIAGTDNGNVRFIQKVYVLQNTDQSPEHFSLDPREQLVAVRDMRDNGLRPIGNWHSHPATPSRPSSEDKKLAFDKSASYLILSLASESPVLNAFHIENGEAQKEIIEIVE